MRPALLVMIFTLFLSACDQNSTSQIDLVTTTTPIPRTDTWWLERHQKVIDADNSDTSLLLVGDSITQYWENGDTGWPVFIEHYDPDTTLNLGFSGDHTQHVLWRLENGELDSLSPATTVLLIGTNNAPHHSSDAIAAGINKIIDTLLAKLPNTYLIVYRIFPRGSVDSRLRKITDDASDRVLGSITDSRVLYLDINEDFLDAAGNIPEDIMADKLHLTSKGYQIWAEASAPYVN